MPENKITSNQGSASSIAWDLLKDAAKEAGKKYGAQMIVKALSPAVRGQVLIPMGRVATTLSPVLRAPIVGSAIRKIATEPIRANPATVVASILLSPTNNFPGSSEEMHMNREWAQRTAAKNVRQDSYKQQQAVNLHKANVLSAANTAAKTDALNKSQLKLKQANLFDLARNSTRVVTPKVQPVKLRPAASIGTPFNLRLMNPKHASPANRMGVSVIRPPAPIHHMGMPGLGIPKLRPPHI